MARKSIADAQAAQLALKGKTKTNHTLNTAITPAKLYIAVTGIDGKLWYINPLNLGQLPAPSEMAALATVTPHETAMTSTFTTEEWEHAGFPAIDNIETTVDWKDHAGPIKDQILA
ncbi:hypothetical protein C0995_005838, partial [Termitomyces sp. Mi166